MGFEFDFQGAQVVANDPFMDGDENGGTRWTFAPIPTKTPAQPPLTMKSLPQIL